MEGGESVSVQNRLDFTKVINKAKPVYYPEEGTDLEQLAMAFHAKPSHPSFSLDLGGNATAAAFATNGRLPAPTLLRAVPRRRRRPGVGRHAG